MVNQFINYIKNDLLNNMDMLINTDLEGIKEPFFYVTGESRKSEVVEKKSKVTFV